MAVDVHCKGYTSKSATCHNEGLNSQTMQVNRIPCMNSDDPLGVWNLVATLEIIVVVKFYSYCSPSVDCRIAVSSII